MPSSPLPARPSEDDALLALRDAVASLEPPLSSIDVAAVVRRRPTRHQRRSSVVRRSVVLAAVAAASAGVIAGVVHLSGTTSSAASSASSASSAAPSPASATEAPEASSPWSAQPDATNRVCAASTFVVVIPAEGPGAESPRGALDTWLQRPETLSRAYPRSGWVEQPTPRVPGGVDFASDSWHLQTTQVPGRGWFVSGGTPPCQTPCSTFFISIGGSGQGAPTAKAAREEWRAEDRSAHPDAASEPITLETTEVAGHGWFVTGGTTCR